ncbi:hypothetical protein [Tumebacillus lipolyticus]|uniref:Uncharacterized protein n=1 Tax=Tumebacillus lipolyticus TaxID=1280370 RepID=A0ABW4ZY68_9BACL
MFTKFSALIGVKQQSVVEPEVEFGCQWKASCVTPGNKDGMATYYVIDRKAVFQYCGCTD